MTKIIKKLSAAFLSRHFIGFCIIGAVNTLDAAFFSWLSNYTLHVQQNVAAVLGYMFSLTIAFFLNCKFVFKGRPTWLRFTRFLISYVPNFIIYFLVTFVTINMLELPQFWATGAAAIAGGPITYLMVKLYAFGGMVTKEIEEEAQSDDSPSR